jgi:hypothetical protein
MEPIEIFESNIRSYGDRAGVFEYTDDTGYFYLYNSNCKDGEKIIGAIPIISGEINFCDKDVEIVWNNDESMVALFILGNICAVFDVESKINYGGDIKTKKNIIPPEIKSRFSEINK